VSGDMPWAKMAHDRMTNFYIKSLRKIGENKLKNPDIPLRESLIRGEVLKRDFTKRQQNIISMIFTLSYYLGKPSAIIPKMQDFEIAGINKVKARKELTQLVEMNVLEWDEKNHIFSIKDIREWKVKYHSGYNDERAKDIFELNLRDSIGDLEE
jgi:hypothetical protein